MDKVELKNLDRLEGFHWWYKVRKLILLNEVNKLNGHFDILDLGSATGGNTLILEDLGHKVVSVEYSDYGVERQLEKGIDVIKADACNLPFLDNSFDLVVCLDVLEHISDDQKATSEIHRVLRSGGTAIIAVPEDMRLWSEHDIAVNHFRRYSRLELMNLLIAKGFVISSIWSVNRYLKPFLRIMRNRNRGSDLKEISKLLNFVLYQIAKFDYRTRFFLKSGVTIWVRATKL